MPPAVGAISRAEASSRCSSVARRSSLRCSSWSSSKPASSSRVALAMAPGLISWLALSLKVHSVSVYSGAVKMEMDDIGRGWAVYTEDDKRLGDVVEVHPHYLLVSRGLLIVRDVYVPRYAVAA